MGSSPDNSPVIQAVIVVCPRCGKQNRLLKRAHEVRYRCGNPQCRESLLVPCQREPSTEAHKRMRTRRFSLIVAFCGVAGIIALGIMLNKEKTTTVQVPAPPQTKPAQRVHLSTVQDQPDMTAPIAIVKPLPPPRFLSNGTVLEALTHYGSGVLEIKNGTARDAVVKLVDKNQCIAVLVVYVRKENEVKVNQVPDGEFCVLFAAGLDWDSQVGGFTREKSFSEFDKTMEFSTRNDTNENGEIIEYTDIYSLTLHRVPKGNITTTKISEKEFLKY